MTDRLEVVPPSTHVSQNPISNQPTSFGSSAELTTAVHQQPAAKGGNFVMKPFLVGAVIACLVAVLVVQQIQISQLSGDLQVVSDNVKSSDVRSRLQSQEQSLGELNSRLSYLDSKINATDQKAQAALNRIKAHEDNDLIGNVIKGIKQSFGFK